MANIEQLTLANELNTPPASSASSSNDGHVSVRAKLAEIKSIIDVMVRRLHEIASTESHPSMFKQYNGSERHGRLRSIAKNIIELANSLLMEVQTSRQCSDYHLTMIIKTLHAFGEEVGHFSPADGKFYMFKLCEKCVNFLKSFNEGLCGGLNLLLESPAAIVTPRLLDIIRIIDSAPVSTLQLATETWEMWAGQGKEAILEIQRISDGTFDVHNMNEDEGDPTAAAATDLDSHQHQRQVSPSERSLASKAFLLCRLVKTMIRKIRLRCIQPIFEPIESFDEILWLDELMEAGEFLFPAIDELATAVIPLQVPSHVCGESVNLVRAAQRVCELGWQQATQDEHQKWFINCHAQLDTLLIPILESNPTR